MKIGDVYYEKHTVVGISKRTNTVSETDVEIVNVLAIEVLDKIRDEIKEMTPTYHNTDWSITDLVPISEVLKIVDKFKPEIEVKE